MSDNNVNNQNYSDAPHEKSAAAGASDNNNAHEALEDGLKLIKKYVGTGLRYIVPIGISVGLIVWLFKKVDFHEVMTTIKEGCDFFWIGVMMIITMVSHMIRGVRWGMQLRAAGVRRMPVVCEWVTIWGAYALNLVFPQLGEAWRCVFVSKSPQADDIQPPGHQGTPDALEPGHH